MKGKITHVIDELKVGGAQTHLVTMLRETINSYPIEHRVVSLFGGGPIGDKICELGISVNILDLRPYLARRQFTSAINVLKDLFLEHSPDLVEAHLTWSRLLGLYAAWRAKVPCRIGFEQGDVYLNSWKFRVANYIGQLFADRVIVCSQALADWVHRTHHVSLNRLAVFHNCVDTIQFKPADNIIDKDTLGLTNNMTIFCTVGSLGQGVNKRVDICIRAIEAARSRGANVGLVICGEGDLRKELENLTADLKIEAYVKFLGLRKDVNLVMNTCDVYCHAAPFEPFGIVCIEAMASGLPVIVPGAGGIREAVDDGVTGFIYPVLNYHDLAETMCRMQADPIMRKKMGEAARKAAENRFSSKNYVERLYRFYDTVGQNGRAKPL